MRVTRACVGVVGVVAAASVLPCAVARRWLSEFRWLAPCVERDCDCPWLHVPMVARDHVFTCPWLHVVARVTWRSAAR